MLETMTTNREAGLHSCHWIKQHQESANSTGFIISAESASPLRSLSKVQSSGKLNSHHEQHMCIVAPAASICHDLVILIHRIQMQQIQRLWQLQLQQRGQQQHHKRDDQSSNSNGGKNGVRGDESFLSASASNADEARSNAWGRWAKMPLCWNNIQY